MARKTILVVHRSGGYDANRKAASIKASQIELDIASGNFDPSLVKYKPQKQESISVSDLFDQFVE